jgi:hypothetical protein
MNIKVLEEAGHVSEEFFQTLGEKESKMKIEIIKPHTAGIARGKTQAFRIGEVYVVGSNQDGHISTELARIFVAAGIAKLVVEEVFTEKPVVKKVIDAKKARSRKRKRK